MTTTEEALDLASEMARTVQYGYDPATTLGGKAAATIRSLVAERDAAEVKLARIQALPGWPSASDSGLLWVSKKSLDAILAQPNDKAKETLS